MASFIYHYVLIADHALLEQCFLDLQNDPQLAQAILGDDINELQNIMRSRHQQRTELKRKQEEELVRISLLKFYFLSKRSCQMKYGIVGFSCIDLIQSSIFTCDFNLERLHLKICWITTRILFLKSVAFDASHILEWKYICKLYQLCFTILRLVFSYPLSCLALPTCQMIVWSNK